MSRLKRLIETILKEDENRTYSCEEHYTGSDHIVICLHPKYITTLEFLECDNCPIQEIYFLNKVLEILDEQIKQTN